MRRLQAHLAAVARSDLRALLRWLSLCALVGVLSGLSAALFVSAVDGLQFLALDRLVGVSLARPAAEAAHAVTGPGLLPRWLLPLVPALGGLLCGLVALRAGRDVLGGGTEVVLEGYHRRAGNLPASLAPWKWLASLLTLGTGGSAGREGPMTLVGAGIGSGLGRLFGLGPREKRLLLLSGAGAAVGAVFRIPLGSAIFAIEVLYRDGFEEEGIFPCLIASVCSYGTFLSIHGSGHLFGSVPLPPFSLAAAPLFALVGIAIVPFGFLFTEALRWVAAGVRKARIPRWLGPCAGGLLVGLLGLLHPDLLGIGYGWVQEVLAPPGAGERGFEVAGLFLLFALGKTAATAITVGSGGSGGTFAPAVVAGGFVGGAVGHALHALAPALAPQPAAFAFVGMGAFLGGVAHVPLAAVVIVSELTGNYDLLVPVMVGVGVSYLLLRRTTLYPAQVRNPAASPARAAGMAAEALGSLRVSDLGPLRGAAAPVPARLPPARRLEIAADGRDVLFPVAGRDGRITGVVTLRALRALLDAREILPGLVVMDVASPCVPVRTSDSLRTVSESLAATHGDETLVLDEAGAILGVVGWEDIARVGFREAARGAPGGGGEGGEE